MTRREVLAAGAVCAVPAFAKKRIDRSRISAITDEIGKTPADAIAFARQYGLQWVELRSVPAARKEYAFLSEPEAKAAAAELAANGLKVSFLNTGLLKFTWPGMIPVRKRQETPEAAQSRLENEKARFERRLDDLKTAIRTAHIFGVDKVRVFTGSRVAEPESTFPRVAEVIDEMAHIAGKEKVSLLIENEGSCNIASSAELAKIMQMIPNKWVGVNWDPQNTLGTREVPFPDGYNLLPKKRIANVQVKGKGVMPSSDQKLDWKAIMQALEKDNYTGKIGLETHIFDGTLIEAAHISMKEILRIVGDL